MGHTIPKFLMDDPVGFSLRSKTVTVYPLIAKALANAIPRIPDPIIFTDFDIELFFSK
jgi:hypothetical protein